MEHYIVKTHYCLILILLDIFILNENNEPLIKLNLAEVTSAFGGGVIESIEGTEKHGYTEQGYHIINPIFEICK